MIRVNPVFYIYHATGHQLGWITVYISVTTNVSVVLVSVCFSWWSLCGNIILKIHSKLQSLRLLFNNINPEMVQPNKPSK